MCGRYASFLPAEAMARIFGTGNPLPNLAPSWNVAPTLDAAVVRRHRETGARHPAEVGPAALLCEGTDQGTATD
jgi:putative SOS response-associated peptidase YedK